MGPEEKDPDYWYLDAGFIAGLYYYKEGFDRKTEEEECDILLFPHNNHWVVRPKQCPRCSTGVDNPVKCATCGHKYPKTDISTVVSPFIGAS